MAYELTPDLVIYHNNCLDGFTAAWVVHRKFGDYPVYLGVNHGDPIDLDIFDGKDVLMVDFSFKRDILLEIESRVKSLVILDHHVSAVRELDFLPRFEVRDFEVGWESFDAAWATALTTRYSYKVVLGYDNDRSGAELAWDFFFPTEPHPFLIKYVSDRDLWRFAYAITRDICAWLSSRPFEFEVWDQAFSFLEDPDTRSNVVYVGIAINDKFQKDLEQIIEVTAALGSIDGVPCMIANLPHTMASEGGNWLADKGKALYNIDVGAAFYIDRNGNMSVSLRSLKPNGTDVSEIAENFGGGGHRHAAGFRVKHDDADRDTRIMIRGVPLV